MAGLIIDEAGALVSSYERPESFTSRSFSTAEPWAVAGHWVVMTTMAESYDASGNALGFTVTRLWDLGPITGDASTDPLYGDPPPVGTAGDLAILGISIAKDWIGSTDGTVSTGSGDVFCGESDYTTYTQGPTFPVGPNEVVTAYELEGIAAPYPQSMPAYCILTFVEIAGVLTLTQQSYHAVRGELPGVYGPERLRTRTWLGSGVDLYGSMAGQLDRTSLRYGTTVTFDPVNAKPYSDAFEYYPFEVVDGVLVAKVTSGYPQQHHQMNFYWADMLLDPTQETTVTVVGRLPTTDGSGVALASTDLRAATTRAYTMLPDDWPDSSNYYLEAGVSSPDGAPGSVVTMSFTVEPGTEGLATERGVALQVQWLEVTGVMMTTGAPYMRFSGTQDSAGDTYLVEVDPTNPDGYATLHPECKIPSSGFTDAVVAPLNDGLLEAPQSAMVQDPVTREWSAGSQTTLVLHRVGRTIGEPAPFATNPVTDDAGNLMTHPTAGHLAVLTDSGWAIYIGNAVDPNYVDPANTYAGDVPLPSMSITGALDFVRRSFSP